MQHCDATAKCNSNNVPSLHVLVSLVVPMTTNQPLASSTRKLPTEKNQSEKQTEKRQPTVETLATQEMQQSETTAHPQTGARSVAALSCDLCDYSAFGIEMQVHLRTAHNISSYQCKICEELCINWDGLFVHVTETHGKLVFRCKLCPKRFTTKRTLKMHKSNCHKTEYQCDKCGSFQQSKTHLKVHLNRHNKVKTVQCKNCDLKFCTNTECKRHNLYKHSKKKVTCNLCGALLASKENLRKHLNEHHEQGRPYPCPECNKVYNRRNSFYYHVKNEHGLDPHLPPKQLAS